MLKILVIDAEYVLIGMYVVRAAIGWGSLGVRLKMEYLQKNFAKPCS
ncbi:hypothetical protein [Candidatus Lokiarchaeum ossiferum]